MAQNVKATALKTIHSFNDFLEDLDICGFTIAGTNPAGVFTLCDLFAENIASQAAHFYDNEILGYQAQSYRGKSSKKEWWYVAASKNCPDTGRRGPSTISLKNLC